MKEKLKQQELARRLEEATAADPQSGLDAETSAWREGWLAWGNLLDKSNAVDSEKLERLLEIPARCHAHASRGHEGCEERLDMPTTSVGMAPGNKATHPRRTWKQYVPATVTALAVSLLLAVGMLKFSPVVEPPPVENRVVPEVSLAWNDGLDYRMTRIEDRLTVAQYGSVSLGNSFDNARSQMESLSRDIGIDPDSM
jgi:hypothetical protein